MIAPLLWRILWCLCAIPWALDWHALDAPACPKHLSLFYSFTLHFASLHGRTGSRGSPASESHWWICQCDVRRGLCRPTSATFLPQFVGDVKRAPSLGNAKQKINLGTKRGSSHRHCHLSSGPAGFVPFCGKRKQKQEYVYSLGLLTLLRCWK